MTILSEAIRRRSGAPAPGVAAPAPERAPRRRVGAVDVAVVGGAILLAAAGAGAALWRAGAPAPTAPAVAPPRTPTDAIERRPAPAIAYAPPPAEGASAPRAEAPSVVPAPRSGARPSIEPSAPPPPFVIRPATLAEGGARTPPPAARPAAPPPPTETLLAITPLEGGLGAVLGSVEIRADGAWRPLGPGETVRVGSEIRAARGARATLDLPGASVDLGGGTHVRIARLQRTGDRPEIGLHLSAGEAAIEVREGATVSLSTPGLAARPSTGRCQVRVAGDEERIAVERGGATIRAGAAAAAVGPGQAAVLRGGALDIEPLDATGPGL